MDKETLSNYGWIVVCIMVLVVMIALATPFGTFIKSGVENTTQGLFDTEQNAFEAAGIDIADQSFEGGSETKDVPLIFEAGAVIPEGGTYYVNGSSVGSYVGNYSNATATYIAGQNMPTTVTTGDVFVYGDYEYRYNYYFSGSMWFDSNEQNGWGVCVLDNTKTEYNTILSGINGQPITSISNAFFGCTSLTTAPAIPSSVTNMEYSFTGCKSLKTAPIIPKSVTNMSNAFFGCTSLTTAPAIPSGVTNMEYSFGECTSLKTYVGSTDTDGDFSNYVIPSSVTNMFGTFSGCKSLKTAPIIPSSITSMESTFSYCAALTTAPAIPSSVTNMYGTFLECTKLTTVLTIPSSVKNMGVTFQGCTNLATAPAIPSSVTNMMQTFKGCNKLTGDIEINATPTSYLFCLQGTQITSISGTCPQATKDAILATK